jgi:hypothetical protein
MDTILVKTDQGRAELSSRTQTLSVLERRLLILADGKHSVDTLQEMFKVPVLPLAQSLEALGLIALQAQPKPEPAVKSRPVPLDKQPERKSAFGSLFSPLAAKSHYAPLAEAATASKAVPLAASPASAAITATTPAPTPRPPILTNLAFDNQDDDDDEVNARDLASDFADEWTSDWTARTEPAELSPMGTGEMGDTGETQPGLLMHRAATAYGLAAGKMYLTETIKTMLGNDGNVLIGKIGHSKTEADLYYVLEVLITTISVYASASEINGIIRRFEEKISHR